VFLGFVKLNLAIEIFSFGGVFWRKEKSFEGFWGREKAGFLKGLIQLSFFNLNLIWLNQAVYKLIIKACNRMMIMGRIYKLCFCLEFLGIKEKRDALEQSKRWWKGAGLMIQSDRQICEELKARFLYKFCVVAFLYSEWYIKGYIKGNFGF